MDREVRAVPLTVRVIPNVDPELGAQLQVKPHIRSLGILTCTIDDVGYTAIDEATKKADVEVVYAKSFYGGSAHASGPLSGEFIGILGGANPEEVKSGLDAAVETMRRSACFYSLNEEGSHAYYAHVVSRTGTYLSELAGIRPGEPLAYLIAPPAEAMIGLDLAMKAANVRLCRFFGPPTETNFAGALLTGSQSDCTAAAEAFAAGVRNVAIKPIDF
ncbi:ethanolamine utilization microcompartment protein EutL [Paenibacillus herberti]|uniref:Microcompartment protein EutL n=1 Tax=Paenibacillus herberti TaxID=1619309 RepID=A0A229NVF3_9BACL|nr:ethanolamine utilization microcompartment protein EutL [Paenibacillus herberti]OXM13820.1 microcompartment protein EutL [Paenibacillus herberti]